MEFKIIEELYTEYDNNREKQEKKLVYETEKGIFGTSSMQDMYDFLTTIEAKKEDVFVDLGSGDGRVVCVASLFCDAIGIEFDETLVTLSKEQAKKLESKATFLQQDYETYAFSKATILFCYADHFFNKEFIEKLKKEFTGSLYIYQGTFFPEGVKKGKTIWVGQTPFMQYVFE